MNRIAVVLSAAAALVLALVNLVLGSNLIMPLEQARERNAGPPWYLVWAMIYVTIGCAVVLGVFLIASVFRNPARR